MVSWMQTQAKANEVEANTEVSMEVEATAGLS